MSDMQCSDDDPFIERAKLALDDSLRHLDPRLAGRLQRGRCEALEMALRPRWRRWVGGVAVASIGLLAGVLLFGRPDLDHHAQPILEDLELMTSTEDVELSEDLEFYDWLAESTSAG